MTSRYTSTASRTIGSRRSAIDIVALSSPWTRPRREVIWKTFGTRRASGRRLWTARARAEHGAIGQQPPVLRRQHRWLHVNAAPRRRCLPARSRNIGAKEQQENQTA